MNITIWVRPADGGQFLVNKNLDGLKGIFDEMFYSDDFDTFKNAVNTRAHIIETYENMDIRNLNTVNIKNKNDYEEEVEYKLVKMTDDEIKSLDEFIGW